MTGSLTNHFYAGDAGQESADVRAPTDYACGHENAIYQVELTYLHVRGYDVHRHADGDECAPSLHVYANAYALHDVEPIREYSNQQCRANAYKTHNMAVATHI